MKKDSIYDLTIENWGSWLKSNDEPAYRAKQIFDWLYVKRVYSIDEMTNLSKDFRKKLADHFILKSLKVSEKHVSKDGTTKYLFKLVDDEAIESVIMKHDYGNSICVSTQAGCKMGCTFCASTIGGFRRNLTAGEIVSQVLDAQKILDKSDEKINSIVIMGSGEPFDNYEETIKFIKIVNDNCGLNIGQRHITVSTSGIVPKIYEFADFNSQVVLAVSLHASNNVLRTEIMPVNKKYPIEELLEACEYYITVTKRRITFEYALMDGVNDKQKDAIELANLLRGFKCHVNLIPVNYVIERKFVRTPNKTINDFKKILEDRKINVTIRKEYGGEIEAACGQLRAKHIDN